MPETSLQFTIRWTGAALYCGVSLLVLTTSAGHGVAADASPAEANVDGANPEQVRFFQADVLPILKANCFKCHAEGTPKGGLRLNARESLIHGGDSGSAVNFDAPAESLILQAINYESFEMPPKGKLPADQIATLTRWITLRAPYSADMIRAAEEHVEKSHSPPPVNEETMQWWSFQPVRRPAVPHVADAAWAKHPIDAFVHHRLGQNALRPNPAADRIALLRRVTYDLTGLPPSPDEIAAFMADTSDHAWETVVNRLLDSPHYGEKWARHWLDVVRYGETNSYERDGAKPWVWRFRDYVIDSFNNDKPFDQFTVEQLAGDELPNPTAESIIATGYYRLGLWQDEPVDPVDSLYTDLDDLLVTTSEGFLGLTIGCARCHDHKIDPMPQRDYYRMLAFFRNVKRYGVRSHETVVEASVREIPTPVEADQRAAGLAEHNGKLDDIEKRLTKIEDIVRPDLSNVELEDFQYEMNRVPLVGKRVGTLLNEKQFKRYEFLTKQWNELRDIKPRQFAQALCVKEAGRTAPPTYVLIRGGAHSHGDEVQPGFPTVLAPPEARIMPPENPDVQSTGRRLALARWIASPDNPLTARVIVNRIWQHHFGRGIVHSSNDYGFQGSLPTHPELLDWLAAEFVDGGWSIKRMHRLILLSKTYRMSSAGNPEALAADPANTLLWRYEMRRLLAEEIRDSILAVNGSLDRATMFGPSIYPAMPQEVLQGQSRPGEGWQTSPPDQQNRRSIYIHVKRSLQLPMMASFDVADPDKTCPVRFVTIQPTQALGMLNSAFVNDQARRFAESLREDAGTNPADQIRMALLRTTQRPPVQADVDRGLRLLESLRRDDGMNADDALTSFCLVTLNLNEFMFLD